MTQTGTMTTAEREAFLAAVHVGILAVDEPGHGPVVLEPVNHDELALATRYLGAELAVWYMENSPRPDELLTLRLRPERWRTWDFAKAL